MLVNSTNAAAANIGTGAVGTQVARRSAGSNSGRSSIRAEKQAKAAAADWLSTEGCVWVWFEGAESENEGSARGAVGWDEMGWAEVWSGVY